MEPINDRAWILAVLLVLCAVLLASCQPEATPTLSPRPTPRATPTPTSTSPVATPEPGHTLAKNAYLRSIHRRVLLEYARRASLNQTLLADAQSRGMNADLLCAEDSSRRWSHLEDLSDETRVISVPPEGRDFQQQLLEALEAGEATAQSHDWFCETYAAFGQPAEGMWARMIQQVQACQVRTDRLHEAWRTLGGEELGLVW